VTLAAGSRLGPYEIVAPLGVGGMGEVYRARDTRLEREVAVKVLPASLSKDLDRLRRFEQEAKAAGVLNHPNITAVHDIGQHDGAPYVVQELLEGETLRQTLAGGRLSPRKAIDYSLQIASGLAAAHEKGIVHRDLKPENLFITEGGRVKILDFGLAKLVQPETREKEQTSIPTASPGTEPGVVLGTVGYMSPEQVKGLAADHRSDIFSFGAILYEMLSGRRAFKGESAVETMSAILKEDPPDLSETNRSLSPGLERLVRHCLEKSAAQRFQSASDLAYDLEALSGISAAPTVGAPALAHSTAKRRLALRTAAVLAIAAAIAAAYFAGRRAQGGGAGGPVFHRMTFRRGILLGARFAPDGKTVVYSASWDGQPSDLFLTRAEGGESKSFGLANSRVLSVSRSGSIAIDLRKEPVARWYVKGTLAEIPLLGGAPRPILEDVLDAGWSPDGKELAVVRDTGGKTVLEFPAGTRIDENPFGIASPSVSPDGRSVAYVRQTRGKDEIVVSDRSGKKRTLLEVPSDTSLVWHPSGREVWFTTVVETGGAALRAVTLAGRQRTLLSGPDFMSLCDIAPDGTVLLERRATRRSVHVRRPQDEQERDLSWLDWGAAAGLSEDGSTVLFSEQGDGGGSKGLVFVRATDGSPAVRLGEGEALALSPDGKWAMALLEGKLRLYPTGTGQSREVPSGNVRPLFAKFFPGDGRRIYVVGSEQGHEPRSWILDLAGGKPRPFTPEGRQGGGPISPDGKLAAVRLDKEDRISLYPVDGGDGRPLPGSQPGEVPYQWSDDGRWLYASRFDEPAPRRVYRIEIATGRRELWKELGPSDRAGLFGISFICITRDGRSYAYSASRAVTSDLYLVEGLK
jgi:Tol biopolymer transport system component